MKPGIVILSELHGDLREKILEIQRRFDPKLDARLRGGLIGTMRYIWVRGPEIPDDSEQAAELTPEDQWELTLDHIGRTSDLVANLRIVKVG